MKGAFRVNAERNGTKDKPLHPARRTVSSAWQLATLSRRVVVLASIVSNLGDPTVNKRKTWIVRGAPQGLLTAGVSFVGVRSPRSAGHQHHCCRQRGNTSYTDPRFSVRCESPVDSYGPTHSEHRSSERRFGQGTESHHCGPTVVERSNHHRKTPAPLNCASLTTTASLSGASDDRERDQASSRASVLCKWYLQIPWL
jgi:hypothetical protein